MDLFTNCIIPHEIIYINTEYDSFLEAFYTIFSLVQMTAQR